MASGERFTRGEWRKLRGVTYDGVKGSGRVH